MHCLGFITVLTLPLLTGCTSSFIDLREHLDARRSSFETKLMGNQALAEQYRACIQQAHDGGSLPLAITTAAPQTDTAAALTKVGARLRVPVQALGERIQERIGNHGPAFRILSDMMDDVDDPTLRRVDLNKLRLLTDAIRQWQAPLDFDDEALAKDAPLFMQLLLAYNRAYFGDLTFAAAPDASAGTVRAVAQVTSRGFVDRSGNTLRFPGLSAAAQAGADHAVEFSATSIDSGRMSADLTRLFLEAFFDAAFRVPAVQHATALRATSQTTPYPAFDASRSPVSPNELATITRHALRTEAVVTALAGKAVRGGSLFSTNNETIAATLETAAGVFAKKLVEHEGFCYFQITPYP